VLFRSKINTGPGVLVHSKMSTEYLLNRNLGVSLSTGYLFAPRGSSKNYTLGAALNYHMQTGHVSSASSQAYEDSYFKGYRINLFNQTGFNIKYRDKDRGRMDLLSLQIDSILNDHVYLPVQAGAAYNAYLGYPGYGEFLAGIGLQSKYDKNTPTQLFAQVMVGTNVHGPILKTAIGLNYGLSDRLAIFGLAGQSATKSVPSQEKFRADYLGLGVTYRFSVPSR